MLEYSILVHPGHSRAYLDNSTAMALAEFRAVARREGSGIGEPELREIGGVHYIVFQSETSLDPAVLNSLSWLSFQYALFELGVCGGKAALLPVEAPVSRYFPDSLGSILKYSGKTNDRFTRMMVNLALSLCATGNGGVMQLLDPMCGKGTTLWEGWMRGFAAAGVEINRAWWQEACTYVVKFLETGRYKHKTASETVPGERGRKLADVFRVQAANSKQAYEGGDVRALTLVHGDGRLTASFFKKASFDLLVADLPYGVQHAGKRPGGPHGGGTAADENLAALLGALLPGWHAVLKRGGAAVLSFNVHTLKREDVEALLERYGFTVMREEPYTGFLHRVDQGIRRDLVAARKES